MKPSEKIMLQAQEYSKRNIWTGDQAVLRAILDYLDEVHKEQALADLKDGK